MYEMCLELMIVPVATLVLVVPIYIYIYVCVFLLLEIIEYSIDVCRHVVRPSSGSVYVALARALISFVFLRSPSPGVLLV